MANLFVSVRDEKGNNNFLPSRINVRLATGHKTSDEAFDDKFTDNGGNLAFVGVDAVIDRYFPSEAGKGFTIYANYRDVNPGWKSASKFVEELDAGTTTIIIQTVISPEPPSGLTTITCPHDSSFKGYGTTQEWKPLAHQLAPNGIMEPEDGPQPNLDAFDRALRNVSVPVGFSPCQLQFTSSGKKKPRIFLPVNPQVNVPDCGMYSRVVDIGSFGFPFFHSSDGNTDVWQLTGRPTDSQW